MPANIPANQISHITPLGTNASVFGRMRVANPVTLFDSKLVYDTQPTWWTHAVSGASAATSHVANNATCRMSTGSASSGSYVYRQTREWFQYQPGAGVNLSFTAVIGQTASNVRKRLGYFSETHGVFFEQSEGKMWIVLRSATSGTATDTRIPQESWNVEQGTGSHWTIDWTKAQIFWLDLQWLGVGVVRVGLSAPDGSYRVLHQFENANSIAKPYMDSGDLPIRFEIENTGVAAGATTMDVICADIIADGGHESPINTYTLDASRGTTTVAVTTRRAVLSIRAATAFSSKTYRGTIVPSAFELYADNPIFWELVYNPSFTGTPTWTSAGTLSGAEYSLHGDAAAGAISAGGTVIHSGYLATGVGSGNNSIDASVGASYPVALDLAGTTSTTLSLVVTRIGASTTNVGASISWLERR